MVAIKGSSSVSLENGSTKSANNSFPRFAVEGNIAKSRLCHHVCHAGTAAAPRAGSRRRLAPPHLPFLIHEKAEANHTAACLDKHKRSHPSFSSKVNLSCFEL